MPGASNVAGGNQFFTMQLYLPSVAVPNVNANTTATQTVTVNGVQSGDLISWNQIGTITGLTVDNIYVSSANTLSFFWSNTTVGNITGSANQAFLISVERPALVGLSSLPSAIE